MKLVYIIDPNRCAGGSEDHRIHAVGCRDAQRHIKHPKFHMAGSASEVEAESTEALIASEIEVYTSQDQGYGIHDFKICNCCKGK